MERTDLLELLRFIPPDTLDYQEWVNVGMALHHEGYTAADWDDWSRADTRYRQGECFTKWAGFHGAGTPVTGGTIVAMAKDYGWRPERNEGTALDWDDIIGARKDDYKVIDTGWVEGVEIEAPSHWSPAKELTTYLETLFEAGETVGYVTETWEKEGRYLPTKGTYSRTAGELIQEISRYKDDLGAAIGDYNPAAGAWIRFNPLDGHGVKNNNVTDYRYALVESDQVSIEKQHEIIKALELPVACLVHSGNKSLHAIVKIEATSYEEYRKRVDFLYQVCQKNGLQVDTQNKNPSRLSRMPGVVRNGKKQFIVATHIGQPSWAEWHEWIEGINDDLPDPEELESVWDNLPPLAPPLIDGVLRQGHKMLLAGPSKAGKSFALIELCIAIAEGKEWLGWPCAKGKVMYVNLELDRASCLHRFRDVYDALGYEPKNLQNIAIWNLRGKSVPMDKLAPKLIRRAQKKDYIAIVIDPIYKVITGDENSADQMAHFTNQFDKVCTELGTAVIYCHHHSKGAQGGKRSMDRASGSGVFARDPDCLLDLIELDVPDSIREENYITSSAWRIEGTLREFPQFDPLNIWFDYPIHTVDECGLLKDMQPEADRPPWQKGAERKAKGDERRADQKQSEFNITFDTLEMEHGEGNVTTKMLRDALHLSQETIKKRIETHGNLKTIHTPGQASKVIRTDSDPPNSTP